MNKIYRVIWNSTLMQWVVTSEFGRARIKRAVSNAVKATGLMAVMTAGAYAATCDLASLNCQLDATWSAATNSNETGAAVITDGNTWSVSGLDTWRAGDMTYKYYTHLQQVIDAGYTVMQGGSAVTSLPAAGNTIIFPGLTTAVTVFDPITSSNKTVMVYSSGAFTELDAYYFNPAESFVLADAEPYIDTRLATVTNGVANISLNKSQYNLGELRESALVYVDGTTANDATANWTSQQLIYANIPSDLDTLGSPINRSIKTDSYAGNFTAFDGSLHTVNSLADFKTWNNWLISKLSSGDLAYTSYQSELKKAYTSTSQTYQISHTPDGFDVSVYGERDVAVLQANGQNATINIAPGGSIDLRASSSASFLLVKLNNNATFINNGTAMATNRIAHINSGSSFINNGFLSLGGISRIAPIKISQLSLMATAVDFLIAPRELTPFHPVTITPIKTRMGLLKGFRHISEPLLKMPGQLIPVTGATLSISFRQAASGLPRCITPLLSLTRQRGISS